MTLALRILAVWFAAGWITVAAFNDVRRAVERHAELRASWMERG